MIRKRSAVLTQVICLIQEDTTAHSSTSEEKLSRSGGQQAIHYYLPYTPAFLSFCFFSSIVLARLNLCSKASVIINPDFITYLIISIGQKITLKWVGAVVLRVHTSRHLSSFQNLRRWQQETMNFKVGATYTPLKEIKSCESHVNITRRVHQRCILIEPILVIVRPNLNSITLVSTSGVAQVSPVENYIRFHTYPEYHLFQLKCQMTRAMMNSQTTEMQKNMTRILTILEYGIGQSPFVARNELM